MELKELKRSERLVLAALLERLVGADALASESEIETVAEIATEIGEDVFRLAVREASVELATPEALKEALMAIKDPDTQDLLYGTALDCALSDGLDPQESELLTWLEDNWDIQVETAAEQNLDGEDDLEDDDESDEEDKPH